MIIGKVIDCVVSTRKNERLIAGIGETVIVAQGSAARIGCDLENAPVDAAIVGIID